MTDAKRVRETVAQSAERAAIRYVESQQPPPEQAQSPLRHAVGKLARLVAGLFLFAVAFRMGEGAWASLLKAEELRAVDVLRMGLALLLAWVSAYVIARDRTMFGTEFAFKLFMRAVTFWRTGRTNGASNG